MPPTDDARKEERLVGIEPLRLRCIEPSAPTRKVEFLDVLDNSPAYRPSREDGADAEMSGAYKDMAE